MLGSTSASLFVHFCVNSCHKRKKNYLFPSLNSFSITCRKNDSRFLNTFVSLFKKIFINSWQKCIHISGSFHREVVRSLFVQTSKINHCNFTKDIPTTLCICVVILFLFREPTWLDNVSSWASVFMQLSLCTGKTVACHYLVQLLQSKYNREGRIGKIWMCFAVCSVKIHDWIIVQLSAAVSKRQGVN